MTMGSRSTLRVILAMAVGPASATSAWSALCVGIVLQGAWFWSGSPSSSSEASGEATTTASWSGWGLWSLLKLVCCCVAVGTGLGLWAYHRFLSKVPSVHVAVANQTSVSVVPVAVRRAAVPVSIDGLGGNIGAALRRHIQRRGAGRLERSSAGATLPGVV